MKTITKNNINNMCTWNSRIRIVNSLFVVVNCCTISAIWNEVYEDGRGRHVRTRFVAEIDWANAKQRAALRLKSPRVSSRSSAVGSVRLASARLLRTRRMCTRENSEGREQRLKSAIVFASAHEKTLKRRKNSVQTGKSKREKGRESTAEKL